jgi:hypothetical protein
MHPWIETFNRIKKHEYGSIPFLGIMIMEYVTWPTEQDKEDNQAIKPFTEN